MWTIHPHTHTRLSFAVDANTLRAHVHTHPRAHSLWSLRVLGAFPRSSTAMSLVLS